MLFLKKVQGGNNEIKINEEFEAIGILYYCFENDGNFINLYKILFHIIY